MSTEHTKLIEAYAHDYRDMAMGEEQLKIVLTLLVNQIWALQLQNK